MLKYCCVGANSFRWAAMMQLPALWRKTAHSQILPETPINSTFKGKVHGALSNTYCQCGDTGVTMWEQCSAVGGGSSSVFYPPKTHVVVSLLSIDARQLFPTESWMIWIWIAGQTIMQQSSWSRPRLVRMWDRSFKFLGIGVLVHCLHVCTFFCWIVLLRTHLLCPSWMLATSVIIRI